jgi:hypothetical protein
MENHFQEVKHHELYSDAAKFSDPSAWDCASYTPDMCAEMGEPLPDVQSDYRTAAQTHIATLKAIDVFMATASNPRLAWITVALTFDLTSVRGLSLTEIAGEMGVSPQTLSRSTAKFQELAGLDPATGSIQANRATLPPRAGIEETTCFEEAENS